MFITLAGKPVTFHFQRYQGFAVCYYSFTLDALELEHHRLLQHQGLDLDIFSIQELSCAMHVRREITGAEKKAVPVGSACSSLIICSV